MDCRHIDHRSRQGKVNSSSQMPEICRFANSFGLDDRFATDQQLSYRPTTRNEPDILQGEPQFRAIEIPVPVQPADLYQLYRL